MLQVYVKEKIVIDPSPCALSLYELYINICDLGVWTDSSPGLRDQVTCQYGR